MTIPITVTGSVVVSGSLTSTGSISNVTASYVAGGDVDGAVANATTAVSASYALTSDAQVSASFATTASYAETSENQVSSSHALQADNAATADSAVSSSHSLLSDEVEFNNVLNKPTLVSSSAQIIDVLDTEAVVSGGADASLGALSASAGHFAGDITVEGTGSFGVFQTVYVTSSIIEASGSTKFGDTSDDVHQRTGSLIVTDGITGDGSLITGIVSASHSAQADNARTADVSTLANAAGYAVWALTATSSISSSYAPTNESANTGSFTGSFLGGIDLTENSSMSQSQFAHERVDLGAKSADFTVSFDVGNVQRFEATADVEFAIENLNGIGLVECENSGAFDVTLPSALWSTGSTQTTGSKATGSIDVFTFYQAGTNLIGSVMALDAQ